MFHFVFLHKILNFLSTCLYFMVLLYIVTPPHYLVMKAYILAIVYVYDMCLATVLVFYCCHNKLLQT